MPIAAIYFLCATYLFVAAATLFLMELVIGKLLLPQFGGVPAVWTTCLVFFQVVLVGGYAIAGWWSKQRVRIAFTFAILGTLLALGTFLFDVTSFSSLSALSDHPVVSLIGWLVFQTGATFVVISLLPVTTQSMFSRFGKEGTDPYGLYIASNLGSFVGLLSYPLWIEQMYGLKAQIELIELCFYVLIVVSFVLAIICFRYGESDRVTRAESEPNAESSISLPLAVLLAFLPSALNIAVTSHLTVNVAPIPLVWILPLSVYLCSFVVVFSRVWSKIKGGLNRYFPAVLLTLGALPVLEPILSFVFIVLLHLTLLLLIALVCHGRLADSRPPPAQMGNFYLRLSIGGAMGAIFSSILAPIVFDDIYEYAILVGCAALALRTTQRAPSWVIAVLAGYFGSIWFLEVRPAEEYRAFLLWGIPAILTYSLRRDSFRFSTAFLITVAGFYVINRLYDSDVELRLRNFYGVKKVINDPVSERKLLAVGDTVHGAQSTRSNERLLPILYNHSEGPLGDVFDVARSGKPLDVAILGLGIGSIACYGQNHDTFTFIEIDPQVIDLVKGDQHFTFFRDCAGKRKIIEGDGRLEIARYPEQSFDVIIVDAFSSDMVPVHLLTSEALAIYFDRLREGGFLVFHTSNRFVRLEPIVAAGAETAGARSIVRSDGGGGRLKFPSTYVVVSRKGSVIDSFTRLGTWNAVFSHDVAPWTDDYSNVFGAMK